MLWIYLVGSGLHPLLAREFAPLAQRLASVTGRLEGIPTLVADARATIGSVPERPVSRLHAEIAAKRIGGVADLGKRGGRDGRGRGARRTRPSPCCCRGCGPHPTRRPRRWTSSGGYLPTRWRPPPRAARRSARRCSPRSCATRCATRRSRRAAILARAEARVRGRARRDGPHRARRRGRAWCPATRPARRRGRGGPGRAGRDRGRPSGCRRARARTAATSSAAIEAFCASAASSALADEPLEIDWTPEFMRSFGGAFLDSPGPLDRGQKTFFWITPSRRLAAASWSSRTCAR